VGGPFGCANASRFKKKPTLIGGAPISQMAVTRRNQTNYQPSTIRLFIYDLDLLVDHLPGKPVDGHMNPIPLLSVHNEAILKICSV
jgi:hypothetical protein